MTDLYYSGTVWITGSGGCSQPVELDPTRVLILECPKAREIGIAGQAGTIHSSEDGFVHVVTAAVQDPVKLRREDVQTEADIAHEYSRRVHELREAFLVQSDALEREKLARLARLKGQ